MQSDLSRESLAVEDSLKLLRTTSSVVWNVPLARLGPLRLRFILRKLVLNVLIVP